MILRVPVTFVAIADWVRKCAVAVNQLIIQAEERAASPFLTSVEFPASPVEGQAVYRSDLHTAYVWDGTGWRALWS